MSRIRTFTGRLTQRFRQPDIQNDTDSLTAAAFRQRLLGQDALEPLAGSAAVVPPKRVAAYRPRSNPLLRTLRRLGLGLVAPLIAIALIVGVTLSIVNQEPVSQPQSAETTFDSNIPVPAGVRPIRRVSIATYNVRGTSVNTYRYFLGSYIPTIRQVGTYISPQSKTDLDTYYRGKLLVKGSPWQVYGKPTSLGDQFSTLYIRSVSGQQTLEGLLVQLQPVDKDILKQDPAYYDRQAKEGETVLTLSTAILTH